MSVTEMIGWDLLHKLIEKDLKTESDVIVAIAHWFLIKQATFRCLGTGDEVRNTEFSLRAHSGNGQLRISYPFYCIC